MRTSVDGLVADRRAARTAPSSRRPIGYRESRFPNVPPRHRLMDNHARCPWAGSDPLYVHYHDHEWGVPLHDDGRLFEMLVLEGAQAGLSWITILRKRDAYRDSFDGFDPATVARYGGARVDQLLRNPGIVRNRLKVQSAVTNARAFLAVQEQFGSFDAYVWRFVDGQPRVNAWTSIREIPASTSESDAMSRDLRQRGFKFVGPTICYAHMQATGMVNDHLVSCFRYAACGAGPPARSRSAPR